MRYFRKIVGDRIYLSPMNAEDAEQYTKWLNDKAVSGFLGNYAKTISLASEQKALENMTTSGYNFAIVSLADDMLLGNISLMDYSGISQTATAGLFIGDLENRGAGIGAEALRLILDFGFRWLNLKNIMLTLHSDNERGFACYKKVGFKEFGRRRCADFKDGRFVDTIYMDILREEFI